MSIDVKVGHLNVHQPASDSVRRYNIDELFKRVLPGGVATLNEIGKSADHRYIAGKSRGIGYYLSGELGIVWDAARFEKVTTYKYRIQLGGHIGADGVKGGDDRRVGPSRWLIIAVLRDRASGIVFQVVCTHLMARADTAHKWRRPLRAASIKLAGLRINNIAKTYPNGVFNGDMNYIAPRIDWPYLAEIELPSPATYGKRLRYDRGYVFGAVKLKGKVDTFNARSDHKGIVYTVTIGDGPTVGAPATGTIVKGHVTPVAKNRPPVKHPWASKSAKWKRRYPKLWRRILAWRKANKN